MALADGFSADAHVSPSEELARIVRRADSLGFCRRRVATALGMSANDLALIERRDGLCDGTDHAVGEPR